MEANLEDFEGIWQLIQETEDQTDRWISKEDLRMAAFGGKGEKCFEYVVAKNNGRVVAVASIFYLYSTWDGKGMCADEFLSNSDVDNTLLRKLFLVSKHCIRGSCSLTKLTLERGCHRLKLTLRRNDSLPLQRYTNWGGEVQTEWLTVRLPKNALRQFADEKSKLKEPYHLRMATKEDIKSILYLIQCLAEYEKEPNAVNVNEEILLEDGFGKESHYQCFIAETDEPNEIVMNGDVPSAKMSHDPKIIGIALYQTIYCKRRGRVLHLEDLFVKEEHRNHRVGTELMRECAKTGVLKCCEEMDWQVLDWNTKPIELYERLGGIIIREPIFVKFTDECIKKVLHELV